MTRVRPSTGRTLVRATVAVGAAVLVQAALPAAPPLSTWFGPVETPVRLAAAVLVGGLGCLLLASLRTPRDMPARVRQIAVGLAAPVRGRLWLAGQIVVEEAAWRGCLLPVLAAGLGIPVGVAVSSIAFGVWHVQQGWPGVLANTVNGLTFSVSFLALGGLPAAAFTHATHNLTLAALILGQHRNGEHRALA